MELVSRIEQFSEISPAYLLCQLKPIPENSVKNIGKFFLLDAIFFEH